VGTENEFPDRGEIGRAYRLKAWGAVITSIE
jgi:hypothetical protein